MTTLELLKFLRDEWKAVPQSKEGAKIGLPSNAELRRWCDKSCVEINNAPIGWKDELPNDITSFVFFPKSTQAKIPVDGGRPTPPARCTLFVQDNDPGWDESQWDALLDLLGLHSGYANGDGQGTVSALQRLSWAYEKRFEERPEETPESQSS